jgi:hypothetical protein
MQGHSDDEELEELEELLEMVPQIPVPKLQQAQPEQPPTENHMQLSIQPPQGMIGEGTLSVELCTGGN